jgi:thymidine kinase
MFADHGKVVIVAGLDGTFQKKPFGRLLELIPIAERVVKLSAICVYCGKDAAFTQRIVDNSEVELIGGEDVYRPTCRKCYTKTKIEVEENQEEGENTNGKEVLNAKS